MIFLIKLKEKRNTNKYLSEWWSEFVSVQKSRLNKTGLFGEYVAWKCFFDESMKKSL